MGEGTVFISVCLSVHTSMGGGVPHLRPGWGGYPIPAPGRGVPHPADRGYPRSRWGVPHPADGGITQSQVWMRGYSIPGPGRGYLIQLIGGIPSQVWIGGATPSQVLPSQDWMGYPLGQDCMGVPPVRTGWSIPPTQDWMGYPPPP